MTTNPQQEGLAAKAALMVVATCPPRHIIEGLQKGAADPSTPFGCACSECIEKAITPLLMEKLKAEKEMDAMKAAAKINSDEWRQRVECLDKEMDAMKEELRVSDAIIAERSRLLDLFECAAHGKGCVPDAINQVKALRESAGRMAEAMEDVIYTVSASVKYHHGDHDVHHPQIAVSQLRWWEESLRAHASAAKDGQP